MRKPPDVPDISLIVPVYQAESVLEKCVDSVLAQDHQSFELILVDDGSTDSSGALCDAYALRDSRVHVIHQPNTGQTRARQAGLAAAQGRYVWFVDSDDWLVPESLSRLVSVAREHDADIVTFDVYFNYQGRRTQVHQALAEGVYNKKRLEEEIYPRMIYSGKFFYFGVFAAMWNKVWRRELATSAISEVDLRVRIGEDGLTTFAAFLDASRVVVLAKEYLYNYRHNNPSITRSYCKDQLLSASVLLPSLRSLAENKGYDLQTQIDYYAMHTMWSICVEEFFYRHRKGLIARVRYIAEVMHAPETMAASARVSTNGLRWQNRVFFVAMKRQWLAVAVAISWYVAMERRLRVFAKRVRRMY